MEAGGKRVDVGKVLSEVFSTYGANLGVLLGGAFTVVGGAALVDGALQESDSVGPSLIGTVISVVAGILFTGVVVKLVEGLRAGKKEESLMVLIRAAAPFGPNLLLNGLVTAIGVGLGLLALIVPGLYLITIWAVAAPAVVIESKGPVEALGRSRELVRGNGWPVFAIVVVTILITLMFAVPVLSLGSDGSQIVVGVIASALAAPVQSLVSSILFFELRDG